MLKRCQFNHIELYHDFPCCMLCNSANSFLPSAKGIFEEEFVKPLLQPEFLKAIDADESNSWVKKYKKSVNESLRDSLVENVGKPIDDLFT